MAGLRNLPRGKRAEFLDLESRPQHLHLPGPELYGFICGASIGLVIGLVLGLKNRRDILDASDDLLAQIEELKG